MILHIEFVVFIIQKSVLTQFITYYYILFAKQKNP